MTEPRCVLIVEDDALIRDFLSDALKMQGFTTETVADGRQALDRLAAGDIDLVLSDVNMPNMDGVELCRRATSMHPDMPVVLITGMPPDDREALREQSGAVALLRKPIGVARLHDILCVALGTRRPGAESTRSPDLP
jgi:CheY-like chemotaxis protein